MTAIRGSFACTSPRIQRRHKSSISAVAPIKSDSSASSIFSVKPSRTATNAGIFPHAVNVTGLIPSRSAIAFSGMPVAVILAAYRCGSLSFTLTSSHLLDTPDTRAGIAAQSDSGGSRS